MAGQPVIASDAPPPDPSGLATLNAGISPQTAAAAQRSQDLARALAAMRDPANDLRAPVDPSFDRLAEALMQRRYGPSTQDFAQAPYGAPYAPSDDPGLFVSGFHAFAAAPGHALTNAQTAIWNGADPTAARLAPMDSTFAGLISAQPTGALQGGDINFDDLIPNQGAPWWSSSAEDAAAGGFGRAIGDASSSQETQDSQSQLIQNWPPVAVTPVPTVQLDTTPGREAQDLQPLDLPTLETFVPPEDEAGDPSVPQSGAGSSSVFAPTGTGQIGAALKSQMMSGADDAQLSLASDSGWNMWRRAYRAPNGVVMSALGDTPGNGMAQFGDNGYVPGSFRSFDQPASGNPTSAPPTFLNPTIVATGKPNSKIANPYSNVAPIPPVELDSAHPPEISYDQLSEGVHLGLGAGSFAPGALGSAFSTVDAAIYLAQALRDLTQNDPKAAEQHAVGGLISAGAAIGGLAFDAGAVKAGLEGLFGAEKFAPVLAGAEAAAQAGQAGGNVVRHAVAGARGGVTILNATANGGGGGGRPWRQSEVDVGHDLGPGHNSQQSYLDGKPVRYGTRGSVRPDWVAVDDTASHEVKNFDVARNSNGLINKVSRQAIQRARHLPPGMRQNVVIDVRGQNVTPAQERAIVRGIVSKSNGALTRSSVRFKR